ncbi:MAG: hypothetical protein A2402_02900 [Candidatus Staskawiczbacteria bacterium RIFOXYC1_FULL_37_43]|nr:MAG: hypothetical protein A2813_03325 [Candidatus Staskawiczbacteria bacterium RIFCSPHIGHO2_01_FULL_37_17]OGZ71544.1 MAG: hypothetical protein A2891_02485 [Candidatus Staskawiczbacteria bacterium RIFCSPLOWO2_01_FULL_37_19]OGZ76300.1 MAG: hypothetical protein A2205_00850 [Candidatus Staskawiczbacteria bacterium RIFOXYA1_FULL_37_15]OGZ76975.1 MAG: hypothetical protein A2280_01505 [Candidatus Staskawiczbacteria bacterium RIFOXYA12_FULL_37_10]OGZ80315.1 MAG: hypothetical protein A2353_03560 [Can
MENILAFILGWYGRIGFAVVIISAFVSAYKNKGAKFFFTSLIGSIDLFIFWPLFIFELITKKTIYSELKKKLLG